MVGGGGLSKTGEITLYVTLLGETRGGGSCRGGSRILGLEGGPSTQKFTFYICAMITITVFAQNKGNTFHMTITILAGFHLGGGKRGQLPPLDILRPPLLEVV